MPDLPKSVQFRPETDFSTPRGGKSPESRNYELDGWHRGRKLKVACHSKARAKSPKMNEFQMRTLPKIQSSPAAPSATPDGHGAAAPFATLDGNEAAASVAYRLTETVASNTGGTS